MGYFGWVGPNAGFVDNHMQSGWDTSVHRLTQKRPLVSALVREVFWGGHCDLQVRVCVVADWRMHDPAPPTNNGVKPPTGTFPGGSDPKTGFVAARS